MEKSTWTTKVGLAQMLKGGVIMDVVTPEQARIAEEAGAVAVMALERVPADIRKHGGVARMPASLRPLPQPAHDLLALPSLRRGHLASGRLRRARQPPQPPARPPQTARR